MESEHSRLHQKLAVLAPPRRFELLVLLLSGVDRSVSQLAAVVGLSQSCTTRHLQALERAGLVKRVRDGKRVVFRTAPRDATAAGVLASVSGAPGTPLEGPPGPPPRGRPGPVSPPRSGKRPIQRSDRLRSTSTGTRPGSRSARRRSPEFGLAPLPSTQFATDLSEGSDIPDSQPPTRFAEGQTAGADPAPAHDETESGKNIARRAVPSHFGSDIEDFLL